MSEHKSSNRVTDFEVWARQHGISVDRSSIGGAYLDMYTRQAWYAWDASANRYSSVETFELRTVPSAWMRGIPPVSTPDGPGEWEVDFSYGDDQPEGDGWVPLYSKPPHIRPAVEPADRICSCGKRMGEHPVQAPWWPCMVKSSVPDGVRWVEREYSSGGEEECRATPRPPCDPSRDPDDAPELTEADFERAVFSIGGKRVSREKWVAAARAQVKATEKPWHTCDVSTECAACDAGLDLKQDI